MAWTPVDNSGNYPELMLEWAPTTQPTDAAQTYVDITDRLRDWSWGYGRNDELARFEAGTGTVILDNSDRAFDPTFDAGAWFGNIKPRRMFRLRYRYSGVTYPGFVAYARGFPQTYVAGGQDKLVKVDLVDAFAIMQGVDLVVGFSRPAELSGERIAAVLDAVGIPAALRDLDAGTVTVGAFEVTSAGTSGLDHAKSIAIDSEFGQLFVAKDGRVTFHDYVRRLNAASLHSFTDAAGAALGYGLDFAPNYDETYLWNYVRVTGADGEDTVQLAEDAASQDDYHILTKPISTELVSGSDVMQVAQRWVLKYAQPEKRAASIQLHGAGSPTARWPVVLDLEVSDRVTVTTFAGSADPDALPLNVEAIRHSCKPGGPWTTSLATSPADTHTYLELNHATFGELDDIYALA